MPHPSPQCARCLRCHVARSTSSTNESRVFCRPQLPPVLDAIPPWDGTKDSASHQLPPRWRSGVVPFPPTRWKRSTSACRLVVKYCTTSRRMSSTSSVRRRMCRAVWRVTGPSSHRRGPGTQRAQAGLKMRSGERVVQTIFFLAGQGVRGHTHRNSGGK